MLTKFRKHHFDRLVALYRSQQLPLDRVVRDYFRAHHALGSKDRKSIGDKIFNLVRWGVDLEEIDPWERAQDLDLSLDVRCGCPKDAFEILTASLGSERAFELCLVSNETAPTTVRVNTVKTTREELLLRWAHWHAQSCELSDVGIRLPKREALMALPEFRDGWFELQDEASQRIAQAVAGKPGDLVLDFCAGAGGKSLAIAPQMEGRGQLFLHDIRPSALMQAKKRLRRAGVQNIQLLGPQDPRLKRLKGRMDWVLVDAPCSGTGTWRRNVDMKRRFSRNDLERLIQTQRDILTAALDYLKPSGRLVYATCSVLPEENEHQLAWASDTLRLHATPPVSSWPTSGGMDGTFVAVLAR